MLRHLGGVAGRRPEWVERPERGSRFAMRLLLWLTLKLGRPVGRALLYPICAYFVLFSRRARRASAEYLRRALGRRPGLGDVFRHYHAFASTIHDRVYLLAGKYSYFDVTLSAPAGLLARLRQGRGCILLGSHLGSFEILCARSVSDCVPPVNVLMHLDNAEKINSVLHPLAPGIESRIIPLGGPESLLRVRECLARGEIVGMLGDRAWRNERTCSCDFLGARARFPLGPLLLAGLLDAPVVLFFGLYLGGRRYEIRLEPFAEAIPLEPREREAAVRPWVQRYVRRLEHHCRLAPYNWFNFYDYWE
ncbi:MAG TPA: acyl-CoA synthetase [Burkholderiales bacterium]|nr:acyl-CoA synthetase [Burkholderiales bacterium]